MKFCSPGFIEVKETTAVLTAGFIFTKELEQGIRKKKTQLGGKKVAEWESLAYFPVYFLLICKTFCLVMESYLLANSHHLDKE